MLCVYVLTFDSICPKEILCVNTNWVWKYYSIDDDTDVTVSVFSSAERELKCCAKLYSKKFSYLLYE